MQVLKKIALGLLGVWVLTSVVGTEAFRTASSQKQALTVLDAAPDWSDTGKFTGDLFGSASAACDINGDGYADLVVGAPGYTGLDPQGAVYVYYGSATGLGSGGPPLVLLGDVTGEASHFGSSLACADVNGDDYADVIVGEYGYSNSKGVVYVYLGPLAGPNPTHALTLVGPDTNNGDNFGFSVASLGDVNGDGYADFAVGAPGYNAPQGKVYFYLGNSDLGAITAHDLVGSGGAFGEYVASAGDVNGDGLAEVMIGAPQYNSRQGRAFVYLGDSSGLSATPAITLTGEAAANFFGQSGGRAGDVNGDGYTDLIIGASGYMTSTGRAYVYFGSSVGLSATPALTLTGEAIGDNFGRSIGTVGDVNGAGYADVVIGADGYSSNRGRAYLYLGSQAGLSATAALTLTGQTASERFGANVAWAGDVNSDGYADFAVGAPAYTASKGAISVYQGSAFLPSATPQRVLTGEEDDRLGAAAATAGDVNGDGYADVIIGASGYASGQVRGQAYLFLGSNSGLGATPTLALTGENPGDLFGSAVATAGDVNGDGYADVVVGASGYMSNIGRAYLYLGSPAGLSATPVLTLTGESPGDGFGASVGTAGDVDGDGYTDLIIGASGYMTSTGRVYVYLGSRAGLSATPAPMLTGENLNDLFGSSVAASGDVNGDGYADVIVGASGYMSSTGRAYVYLGSSAGLNLTPALTLTGQTPGDFFGASVGTAGDVNGDGYADVVVGASGYMSNTGRAYLYLGSSAGLSLTPALTLTGQTPGDFFGASVGTAGDVNGDGYADFVGGAPWAGKVYVYSGGNVLLNTPAITLTDGNPGDDFGVSAGTAGDVNGDDFSDIIVGASEFGKRQGRAYLHLGNGGGGKETLARAERPTDGLVIQPWGLSQTPYGFQMSLAASDPMGRGRVKLQTQICPPGIAFSDPMCLVETSLIWQDVAASPTVTLTVANLEPNTLYRWRARVLHAPFSVTSAGAPNHPAHGPWRRFLAQSQEADVKTARIYWMYLPLIAR